MCHVFPFTKGNNIMRNVKLVRKKGEYTMKNLLSNPDTKLHYKMYKSGKNWMIAGLLALSMAGSMGLMQSTAHADTTGDNVQVTQPANNNSEQQSTSLSTNSSVSTNTNNSQPSATTQSVNVDHSALDQSIQKAKDAGIKVNPGNTQTVMVPAGQVESEKQKIQQGYEEQQKAIDKTVAEHNTQVKNYDQYNGSKGDTSSLDEAIHNAQNVPGLNLVKDEDQTINVDQPTDDSIQKAQERQSSDYLSQAQQINNAITTQKQNNEDYAKKYAAYLDQVKKLKEEIQQAGLNSEEAGIDLAKLQQELAFNKEPNAQLEISSNYPAKVGQGSDGGTALDVGINDILGNFATVTWSNLQNSYYDGHRIAKVVATLSNLKFNVHDGKYIGRISIPKDPSGFFAINGNSLDVDYTYYDENGNVISFGDDAYLSAGGMESWARGSYGLDSEAVQLLSDGQALHLPGSSIKVHDGNLLYADTNNTDTSQGSKIGFGKRNFDNVEQYYREGLFKVTGNHIKVRYTDVWSSPEIANWIESAGYHVGDEYDGVSTNEFGGLTMPIKQTTNLHYHYDVMKVKPSFTSDEQVNYQLTNLVTPVVNPQKTETDDAGNNTDKKALMEGDTVHFGLGWSMTPYKGIQANSDSIKKGFYYIDDYQDDALEPDLQNATITDTTTGQQITGFTLTKWNSLSEAPQAIQDIVNQSGVKPEGAFLLWSANDPESFYNNYVVTGHDLKINLPMTVKQDFAGTLHNQAYQIDFGTGHPTNVVENPVNKRSPHKDVVVKVGSDQSVNGQEVKLGDNVYYELDSSVRPANYGGTTNEWSFTDNLDATHDQATGQNYVLAKTAMTLGGKEYKAGDDITDFFDIKEDGNKVTFTAKQSFLDSINDPANKAQAIQWAGYIGAKRIAPGDATNTFEESYNHQVVKSNTVTTHTPKPETPKPEPKNPTPAPEKPTPSQPAPVQVSTPAPAAKPQQPQKTLPQTGNSNDKDAILAALGLGLVGVSLIPMGKKRYSD